MGVTAILIHIFIQLSLVQLQLLFSLASKTTTTPYTLLLYSLLTTFIYYYSTDMPIQIKIKILLLTLKSWPHMPACLSLSVTIHQQSFIFLFQE